MFGIVSEAGRESIGEEADRGKCGETGRPDHAFLSETYSFVIRPREIGLAPFWQRQRFQCSRARSHEE
jgi:hypothetical protein